MQIWELVNKLLDDDPNVKLLDSPINHWDVLIQDSEGNVDPVMSGDWDVDAKALILRVE